MILSFLTILFFASNVFFSSYAAIENEFWKLIKLSRNSLELSYLVRVWYCLIIASRCKATAEAKRRSFLLTAWLKDIKHGTKYTIIQLACLATCQRPIDCRSYCYCV